MKLNIGDYVRTNKGTIDKLTDKNIMIYEVSLMGFGEKPIKSSPNIIDLIEVGDYVNNFLVINKNKDSITIIELILPAELKEKDIKSVVTKKTI